jgi:hypothetical protein
MMRTIGLLGLLVLCACVPKVRHDKVTYLCGTQFGNLSAPAELVVTTTRYGIRVVVVEDPVQNRKIEIPYVQCIVVREAEVTQ